MRARTWRRVSAQRHDASTSVGYVSLEDVCATGCAVQEGGRACCEEGALGGARSHRGGARRAMCCAAVLPGIRSLATTTEAVGKLLGFRHTALRRLRREGLWRSRELGVAGAGCDGAARAADAVSAAPPSGTCGGGAWPWLWAAHPSRRGCPVSSVNCLRLRRALTSSLRRPVVERNARRSYGSAYQ